MALVVLTYVYFEDSMLLCSFKIYENSIFGVDIFYIITTIDQNTAFCDVGSEPLRKKYQSLLPVKKIRSKSNALSPVGIYLSIYMWLKMNYVGIRSVDDYM